MVLTNIKHEEYVYHVIQNNNSAFCMCTETEMEGYLD